MALVDATVWIEPNGIAVDGAATVAVEVATVQAVVEVSGLLGLRGPAGASAGQTSAIAAVALGGHRVVMSAGNAVQYADQSNLAHRGKVIGVTLGAASAGSPVDIVLSGDIEEPSWSWQPGEVYLGINGLLTQTVPSTGFLQVIGVALTATRLAVNPQLSIQLS